MTVLEYIIVGGALFYSISWVASLILNPFRRAPANTVIAIYWFIQIITLLLIGDAAVLYLIPLMPFTVILCNHIHKYMVWGLADAALKKGQPMLPTCVPSIFIIASLVLIPILIFIAFE